MQVRQSRTKPWCARHQASIRIFSLCHLTLALILIAAASAVGAPGAPAPPFGLAWQVKGLWRVDGDSKPLQTGDTIEPGSLLWPIKGSPVHSITILLPDGQRVLYDCFLTEDCARAFRVPSLYRKPDAKAVTVMWRIHSALVTSGREPELIVRHGSPLPRDEAVVVLNASSGSEVTGLIAALQDGQYTYTLRPLGNTDPDPPRKTLEKKGASVFFDIPSPGLYDVIVTDSLHSPRIDLRIAAAETPRGSQIRDAFRDAKALLADWNEDFQGWPIHDFQRAYLKSLMLDFKLPAPIASKTLGSKDARANSVAEPVFAPRPGQLSGDTTVTLHCDTPGATIHFTVDGSQPLSSSPVYTAPIVVKRATLTIKAFATGKEKDQSAVVTGIYKIGD